MPVEQTDSPFSLSAWLKAEARKLGAGHSLLPRAEVPCQYGTTWQVDGVSFEFLWHLARQPGAPVVRARARASARNKDSCVLRVRGVDRTSTRLISSHSCASRMPSSACIKQPTTLHH